MPRTITTPFSLLKEFATKLTDVFALPIWYVRYAISYPARRE